MVKTVNEVIIILDKEISKLEEIKRESSAYSLNSIRFGLHTLIVLRKRLLGE